MNIKVKNPLRKVEILSEVYEFDISGKVKKAALKSELRDNESFAAIEIQCENLSVLLYSCMQEFLSYREDQLSKVRSRFFLSL